MLEVFDDDDALYLTPTQNQLLLWTLFPLERFRVGGRESRDVGVDARMG